MKKLMFIVLLALGAQVNAQVYSTCKDSSLHGKIVSDSTLSFTMNVDSYLPWEGKELYIQVRSEGSTPDTVVSGMKIENLHGYVFIKFSAYVVSVKKEKDITTFIVHVKKNQGMYLIQHQLNVEHLNYFGKAD